MTVIVLDFAVLSVTVLDVAVLGVTVLDFAVPIVPMFEVAVLKVLVFEVSVVPLTRRPNVRRLAQAPCASCADRRLDLESRVCKSMCLACALSLDCRQLRGPRSPGDLWAALGRRGSFLSDVGCHFGLPFGSKNRLN